MLCGYASCTSVMLQGTRRRAFEATVSFYKQDGFQVFDFGYARTGNRHAGVLIALNESIIKEGQIVGYQAADGLIQGRVGAVRTKSASHDTLWVSAYPPPSVSTVTACRVYRMVMEFLCKLVSNA